jgi:alpha-1,2-mannosyltransferase
MSPALWRAAYWIGAVALSAWAAGYAIDFSVYWTIALAHIRDGRGLYGEDSILPWPMWYRYPPLFAWLVYPLALLPFRAAAFVWAVGKFAAGWRLVRALLEDARLPCRDIFLAAALAAPYVVSELRYGNAQFYVFALTAAALLLARTRPGFAGATLGFAVALKVWPLFFVPYLAVRGLWRVAGAAVVAAILFTLAPALWIGWDEQLSQLAAWYAQESAIAADGGRVWFPSQSLFGVLSRHLTFVDWRSSPDPNYPAINWLALDPEAVRTAWILLAGAGYAGLLWLARRLPAARDRLLHGVAFCGLILLEPYAQKQSALAVLLWPAVVAAALRPQMPRWGRYSLIAAAAISLLQPLTPSSYLNRLYQVLGLDAL